MTGFGRRVTGEVLSRVEQMQQKTPGRWGVRAGGGLSSQEPQSDSPKGLGGLRSLFLGASSRPSALPAAAPELQGPHSRKVRAAPNAILLPTPPRPAQPSPVSWSPVSLPLG